MSSTPPVISIQLQRTDAIYAPGETVEGSVKFQFFANTQIRALKLEVTGKFKLNWRYRDLLNDDNKTYFQQQLYLRGRPNDDSFEMRSGEVEFPFKFLLPNNIPSSYTMTFGHVRYTLEGIIDESWRAQHKREKLFVVETPLIFSRELLTKAAEVTKRQNFCCFPLCLPRGNANIRCSVPKSVYYVGETINATVSLDVRSSSVEVLAVTMQLRLRTICRPLANKVKMNYEEEIIKETQQRGPFPNCTGVLISMEIPATPPSYVVPYEKIEVQYTLILTTHVSGCHFAIKQKIPLLIGSKRMQAMPSIPLSSIELSSIGLSSIPQPPTSRSEFPPLPIVIPLPWVENAETTNPRAQLLNSTT